MNVPILKRNVSIDVLKSVAIIGVLIIHISADGIISYPVGSFNWVISVFWGSIIRFSVPIFFMCSGALMLDPDKNISIKKLYTKYIFRILIALFIWAFAYELFNILRNNSFNLSSVRQAFVNLFTFNHHFHFYYLHMIILNYVFLPIFRVFTRVSTKKEIKYALLIWFILGIVFPTVKQFPPFNLYTNIVPKYIINSTYASIGYGLLGYYIKKYMPSRVSVYALIFALGFLFSFGGTLFLSTREGAVNTLALEAMTIGVAFMSLGLFGAVCKIYENTAPKLFFTRLSAASFCIYLVHDFFNIVFRKLGISVLQFSPIWSTPIIAIAVLALSYCVYMILKKIPIVNRYLI